MIDSHAHVAFDGFDEDRDEVIARAREAGVSWIEIGTDVEQSRKAVELARKLDGVYATVGVHPSDVSPVPSRPAENGTATAAKGRPAWNGIRWDAIEDLLSKPKVVAVGEVGIDLYHSDNVEEQLEALEKFVGLAREKDLPMVFHVRDGKERSAHDEMIKFLRNKDWHRGVIHTFSGTKKQAEEYLDMGLYLSFSGVVTFKNTGEILVVAKTMPLEKMLIETDCPFLAPEPFRGKRNEPAYVKYVAEKIAEIRGISVEEVAQVTEENARRLFQLG